MRQKQRRKIYKRHKFPPRINLLVGDAIKIIPTLTDCFDAVFIDAEKTEYLQYLRLVERNLQKGSVVVADNAGIFAYQMQDYLSYVRNSGKYKSRFIRVGEYGLEVSQKI